MNSKTVAPLNNKFCLCGEKKANCPNKDCPLHNNRED